MAELKDSTVVWVRLVEEVAVEVVAAPTGVRKSSSYSRKAVMAQVVEAGAGAAVDRLCYVADKMDLTVCSSIARISFPVAKSKGNSQNMDPPFFFLAKAPTANLLRILTLVISCALLLCRVHDSGQRCLEISLKVVCRFQTPTICTKNIYVLHHYYYYYIVINHYSIEIRLFLDFGIERLYMACSSLHLLSADQLSLTNTCTGRSQNGLGLLMRYAAGKH